MYIYIYIYIYIYTDDRTHFICGLRGGTIIYCVYTKAYMILDELTKVVLIYIK